MEIPQVNRKPPLNTRAVLDTNLRVPDLMQGCAFGRQVASDRGGMWAPWSGACDPSFGECILSGIARTSMEFESFFPEPPELKKGQKWHIFVSYRSTDRPWVLKLYDALKHLKYEVFVNQFVLSAGAPLAASLGDGVNKSGAAVIVWSKNYATSKWTDDEYNAIKSRQNSDPTFRLGIAKKDATPIQGLLAGQISTDFSDQPDGPCGEALLRLLLGMSGRPLPPGAVQLATQIDGARKKALIEIKTARQDDDPARIIELAKSDDLAWTSSPMCGCAAVEALIAAERFDAANEILMQLRKRFPAAVRPRQLEGLAARRRGDWQGAMRILGAMYSEDYRDSETIGMYAATWMVRYRQTGTRLYLVRSRDLYREAFETFRRFLHRYQCRDEEPFAR